MASDKALNVAEAILSLTDTQIHNGKDIFERQVAIADALEEFLEYHLMSLIRLANAPQTK